jgi:hypothetical protein
MKSQFCVLDVDGCRCVYVCLRVCCLLVCTCVLVWSGVCACGFVSGWLFVTARVIGRVLGLDRFRCRL